MKNNKRHGAALPVLLIKSMLALFSLFQTDILFAQSKIEDYVEGRRYRNNSNGLIIQYGYISALNTYGLTFTNKNSAKFYFMNCDKRLSSDEESMVLRSCMNPNDGSGVGTVYVYPKRFIIQSSDGRMVFDLIEDDDLR